MYQIGENCGIIWGHFWDNLCAVDCDQWEKQVRKQSHGLAGGQATGQMGAQAQTVVETALG